MRAVFSIVSLLIVLGVIAVSVRNELHASKKFLPGAAGPSSDVASAPFGGTSSPTVSQFQRELDKTMREASERAAQAGSAAESP